MALQQVPDNEWLAFFNRFSKEHGGKLATLEAFDAGANDQVIADRLPFVGISADLKDGEKSIAVTLGDRPDDSITHIIAAPSSVMLDLEFDRTNPTLEISAKDDPTVRLSLHG